MATLKIWLRAVSAAGLGAAVGGLWQLVRNGLSPAPEVCFNQPIGPHRKIAWRQLDLDRVKAAASYVDNFGGMPELEHELGSLAPGKLADLVVTDGDSFRLTEATTGKGVKPFS